MSDLVYLQMREGYLQAAYRGLYRAKLLLHRFVLPECFQKAFERTCFHFHVLFWASGLRREP